MEALILILISPVRSKAEFILKCFELCSCPNSMKVLKKVLHQILQAIHTLSRIRVFFRSQNVNEQLFFNFERVSTVTT